MHLYTLLYFSKQFDHKHIGCIDISSADTALTKWYGKQAWGPRFKMGRLAA